jgi:hypothetical protein
MFGVMQLRKRAHLASAQSLCTKVAAASTRSKCVAAGAVALACAFSIFVLAEIVQILVAITW